MPFTYHLSLQQRASPQKTARNIVVAANIDEQGRSKLITGVLFSNLFLLVYLLLAS